MPSAWQRLYGTIVSVFRMTLLWIEPPIYRDGFGIFVINNVKIKSRIITYGIMSFFIVAFMILTSVSLGSTLEGLGLRERINRVEEERILNPQCDFFSANDKDYHHGPCNEEDLDERGDCNKTQLCAAGSHCYMSWMNVSGIVRILRSGCWLDNEECEETPECRAYNNSEAGGVHFCCCLGNDCNRHFYLDAVPEIDAGEPEPDDKEWNPWFLVMYILLPLCVGCAVIIFGFWCYRRNKQIQDDMDCVSVDTPAVRCTNASFPACNESPARPQLLDVKARGRFGKVWRAQLSDQIVAVKTFHLNEKASWQNEQDIFCTPLMDKHDNVLKFYMASDRGEGIDSELWLITEFYDRGSLADFMKVNTVDTTEALRIMQTMASGMSFLHEDIQHGNDYKPSIAHRDFKSKNVLLDQNLNAVIADFGLAVKFTPGESAGQSHGQVGTLRYMAPEVLEGAVNFQKDSFLRIDMYAFGLVIWEILTRCSNLAECGDFRMPFEEELGSNPSMDCMQEFVVEKKFRPRIKEEWRRDKAFTTLCDTMEECWDHDAEARLSAGCVDLRVAGIQRQRAATEQTQLIVNTTEMQNGDIETMNHLNLQMNAIKSENNRNQTQEIDGRHTTSFNDGNPDLGQENKQIEGDAYVVFSDDDRDSGTFANEDTLSHDGTTEQLIGSENSEQIPDVEIISSSISFGTSLLSSSERESDL